LYTITLTPQIVTLPDHSKTFSAKILYPQ